MFKCFIKFCLFCTSYTGPLAADVDSGGWVSLGPGIKKTTEEVGSQEDDPSVWVIFSKQLAGENFMVRFPEDPVYTYLSSEEMQIAASTQEGSYTLNVLKAPAAHEVEQQVKELFLKSEIDVAEVVRPTENTFDILFRKDGKWIAQRLFLTSQHLYIFQTENVIFHRENHQKFIDSLDIDFSRN